MRRAYISEVARYILHDFAQPIQAIYSYCGALDKSVSDGKIQIEEKARKWISTIVSQTERAVRFIKEERGHFVIQPEDSIKERPQVVALQVFESRRSNFQNHSIELTLECKEIGNLPAVAAERLTTALEAYCDILISCDSELSQREIKVSMQKSDRDGGITLKLPIPIKDDFLGSLENKYYRSAHLDGGMGLAVIRRLYSDAAHTAVTLESKPNILLTLEI